MRHLSLAAVALLASTASAAPGETVRLPRPGDPAWETVELPGVDRPTAYRVVEEQGRRSFVAEALCSASGLVVAVPESLDLATTPVLRWRWQAEQVPAGPDERTKPGDDFAARVSVLFPFEPERSSWMERLRNRIAEGLAGREVPGTTLYFVWTSRVAAGSAWKSPYGEEIQLVALERGVSPTWREAAVDVRRAYREAFGRNPPRPAAVGLMTDSDNHCGSARARYADFEFTRAP